MDDYSRAAEIASLVLAVAYIIALFLLTVITIRFMSVFRSQRRKSYRRAEGDILGLLLVTGEVTTLSDGLIYAVLYGCRENELCYLSPIVYVVSRTTSSLLVDLFVIALVSFLLHHHLRASSTGKIPRGLEFANYVLISIYVIADITWGITSVDYVKKSRLCRYCYEDCAAYCNRYSLHSLYNRSAIVAITLDALYALLGGYWLALAIIALKRGQSINLRSSLKFFLIHVLVTLPVIFSGFYAAIFDGVVDFSTLNATDAEYTGYDVVYFLHRSLIFLGFTIIYVKRERWAGRTSEAPPLQQPQPDVRQPLPPIH